MASIIWLQDESKNITGCQKIEFFHHSRTMSNEKINVLMEQSRMAKIYIAKKKPAEPPYPVPSVHTYLLMKSSQNRVLVFSSFLQTSLKTKFSHLSWHPSMAMIWKE